ncbi:MAG: ATP-binding protein [Pseudomonadota bacterium]|nr:ATP-binding protein [Pseudomonadota bacterium]
MDVARADSPLQQAADSGWWARATADGRIFRHATWLSALLLVATLLFSVWVLRRDAAPGTLLSPPLIALLLIANLLPAIALMVLLARRLAVQRVGERGMGSGRLHTRLVALFSVIAAVPTVLVAIFASLLFQSGLEFWFSDRARNMLENTVELARSSYDNEVARVEQETVTASTDLAGYLQDVAIDDPRFIDAFVRLQVYQRNLSEAIIFTVGSDGQIRALALVNPYDRQLEKVITPEKLSELKGKQSIRVLSTDRIGALTPLNYGSSAYLYAARVFDPRLNDPVLRGQEVLSDYRALLARSRTNQLQFNLALLVGALLIVALAIFIALRLADRLLRPVGDLVDAAGRVEEGDFSARVPINKPTDEIAMLATAFNRMTGRLQEQTGALIAANDQLDTRRAFIEAVLSSVTAGVIALDTEGRILLVNRSAETLLHHGDEGLEGRDLVEVSPELAEFMNGQTRDATVTVRAESGQRTLAVKRMKTADGGVMTFDDITDQLSDQRRAAWSDIAQRIAHEIKNPLTPIQLAAERLQRRYGNEVTSDPVTFARLTDTIVRQVGDLRRMVDEFSSFARMPKPVFERANVHDVARAALFLHEVAHPGLSFSLSPPTGPFWMVCDRRQLGQALTNIVKNGVEAIEARRIRGDQSSDGDRVDLHIRRDAEQLVIDITDTGVGLPEERERLTEPYMTTRVRGTGLGLAIVKKIVEEHLGEIAFLDRPGGGTHVRIAFDAERLEERADVESAGPGGGTAVGDGEYHEETD